MNQDQVKEKLQSIYESSEDYTVIFSGKKSRRVNGLYKPSSKEIIIHNKNFLREDGEQNEPLLMYTAIHELAHHVLIAERGKKSTRVHSQEFWATFHDLLDIAKAKGIYNVVIDDNTQKLIDEARKISKQIAELQRDLGKVLFAIMGSCKENGLRMEDVVDKEVQIDKVSAKTAMTAFKMGDQGIGIDIQTVAAKQNNDDKRAAIIEAGREGKSVAQAKNVTSMTSQSSNNKDETVELTREKGRIEKSIEALSRRLVEIEELLISRGEVDPESFEFG